MNNNQKLLPLFDELSKTLWENNNFNDAGDTLLMASKYCEEKVLKYTILSNARMCYFQGNDVPKAFLCLEEQEQLNLGYDWELHRDKANYLRYLDRYDEAVKIVDSLPNEKVKLLAKSWFLHREGKFKEAFQLVEEGRNGDYWWGPRNQLPLPVWNKNFVDNLIVCGESGHGDEIIFSRWIPNFKKYCKNLWYYTDNSLSEVICRNFDIKPFIKMDQSQYQKYQIIPCMSIPAYLGVDNPKPSRYITSNLKIKQQYDEWYPKTKKRIGLCFHGEITHFETNLRTIPERLLIDAFKDLGQLVNLQKDYEFEHVEMSYYPFKTWEDTFALVDTCDLIITCDTSIAHCAGSMGKPLILLMHAAAYFTWNHNENTGQTEWYDNAWSIKQTEPCKWEGCIQKAHELAEKILVNDK